MSSGIAVVIPNFNGEAILGACLDALEAQTLAPDEVLVVDNGSTDGSLRLLAERGVEVLALERNHGFAGGSNRGVAATSAPFVAVLNSDARPQPGWLEHLAAEFGRDEVWCWGSVLVSPETGLVESAADQWSDRGFAYKLGGGLRPSDLPAEPYFAFAAPGAAPLFRRDRFEALGGYEERYFLYYEDIDLAYRALLRGWRALVVPTALVEHELGASGTRPLVRWHVARNSLWTAIRCIPQPARKAIAARVLEELRTNRPRSLASHELRGRIAALRSLRWALRSRQAIQAQRVLEPAEVVARLEPPGWSRANA